MDKTVLLVVLVFVTMIVLTETLEMLEKGVSQGEKKEIVDIHNKYRLMIAKGKVYNQPRATNMKELCWDDKLAKSAQYIANKMKFKHETVIDDRWQHVGQNMALKSTIKRKTGADWPWAVRSWFNEVKRYDYGDLPITGTGHYTQVVWAKTSRIGCGYAEFVDPTKKLQFKRLYVCNYGEGGNVGGMAPYKTGRCGCRGLCKTKCGGMKTRKTIAKRRNMSKH